MNLRSDLHSWSGLHTYNSTINNRIYYLGRVNRGYAKRKLFLKWVVFEKG